MCFRIVSSFNLIEAAVNVTTANVKVMPTAIHNCLENASKGVNHPSISLKFDYNISSSHFFIVWFLNLGAGARQVTPVRMNDFERSKNMYALNQVYTDPEKHMNQVTN